MVKRNSRSKSRSSNSRKHSYPRAARISETVREVVAEELVRIIGVLRAMQLKKVPSVAETIDWGRTLLALGMDTIDDATIAATLGVVLKHQSDQQRAAGELRLN